MKIKGFLSKFLNTETEESARIKARDGFKKRLEDIESVYFINEKERVEKFKTEHEKYLEKYKIGSKWSYFGIDLVCIENKIDTTKSDPVHVMLFSYIDKNGIIRTVENINLDSLEQIN